MNKPNIEGNSFSTNRIQEYLFELMNLNGLEAIKLPYDGGTIHMFKNSTPRSLWYKKDGEDILGHIYPMHLDGVKECMKYNGFKNILFGLYLGPTGEVLMDKKEFMSHEGRIFSVCDKWNDNWGIVIQDTYNRSNYTDCTQGVYRVELLQEKYFRIRRVGNCEISYEPKRIINTCVIDSKDVQF